MYPLSYVINQSCQKPNTVGLTPIKEDPSYIDRDRREDTMVAKLTTWDIIFGITGADKQIVKKIHLI